MKIGLIGAGRMGRPIATMLHAAGHDVTVLVRSQVSAKAALGDGISIAYTIADTVRDAQAVFTVVLTDEQLQSVCLGSEGALAAMAPGSVLIQHTTCNPDTVLSIAAEASTFDINVLDAALSGGPHDIEAGNLTLWVGGDAAVLVAMHPVLSVYSSPILSVGNLGNGQKVKLVNNALFVAQMGLALDAVRLAESLGISEEAILAAIPHGSGASRAFDIAARTGSVSNLAHRLGQFMRKDMAVIQNVAQAAAVDLGAIGAMLSTPVVRGGVLGIEDAEGK